MYSAYNSSLEKNQMMTPPTIGLTSSIVNDKLSNITLEDNSNGLFSMNEDNTAIQTKDGVPLEASQFKITSSNTEINSDDTNAVNKSYCDSNYIRDGASTVTFGGLNISNVDNVFRFAFFSNAGKTYLRMLHNNSQFIYFNKNLIQIPTKLGISSGYGIQFNTNENGGKNVGVYPQGVLKNLVPSTITNDELSSYVKYSLLDNVCPTYQFCQNTYLRKSDAETTYAKTGALGSLIQTASIAWPSGFDTYLTGVRV